MPRHKPPADLGILAERVEGHWELDAEKWVAHRGQHEQVATSLAEYKAAANEWRVTLSDLRTGGLSRAEFNAEHKALLADLSGRIDRLGDRIGSLEDENQAARAAAVTTKQLLTTARNLIVLGFTIIGGLIGIAIYLGR